MNTLFLEQLNGFLDEPDAIAALANTSALINETYDRLNWAGFYLVRGNELVLGPFQGKTDCTHIPFDKGVCGACWREKRTQRVDDVLSFPGHIACDSASRSELCVPVIIDGACIAEIDLDSPEPARFDDEITETMEKAALAIAAAWTARNWHI
ncbi:MAG: GAF domain-containing protein [Solobacterium sp.]|nr:GAF domain-containing protein [Solobacterium sp.]